MNARQVAFALATVLLAVTAHAEPRGTPAEPGRLTPFASSKELSSTLSPLIENADDCQALLQITSLAARKPRPILSPARLDDTREPVQEAGIVKRHGDYLVILHRRRLFTIALGKGALRPVAAVPAVGVETGAAGAAEYQELLLLGDRAVVIGDSYGNAIEIASFRIDRAGGLTREGTWHLRHLGTCFGPSHAAYVVDGKLLIYSWHVLDVMDDASRLVPAVRTWHENTNNDHDDDEDNGYAPTAEPGDIYRKRLRDRTVDGTTLHTLTQCDLAARVLKCSSTVLLGGWTHEFHVSPTALYIWSEGEDDELGGTSPQGVLYRIPYDGSQPGRVPVSGTPYDRFSFRSDAKTLEVLLAADAAPEDSDELPMALLRLPISDITRGQIPPTNRYLTLPAGNGRLTANHFVGDHVLYSFTPFDEERERSHLVAARVSDARTTELDVRGQITSIEAINSAAVALADLGQQDGSEPGTVISKVDFVPHAGLTAQFTAPDASQARALDAFQYAPALANDLDTFAVPLLTHDAQAEEHLPPQVSVAFFANDGSVLRPIGSIASHEQDVTDDTCDVLGCEEWFQNARALFLGDRIFVLLGYELIEAKRGAEQIVETRRVHFAPADIFWPARTTE